MSGYVLHGSLLQLLLEHSNFLNIDISQGSIATCLRWCGILKYDFITNVLVTAVSNSERILTIVLTFSEVTDKSIVYCIFS